MFSPSGGAGVTPVSIQYWMFDVGCSMFPPREAKPFTRPHPSNGLFIPQPPWPMTWVYIIVVETSSWPSNSRIVRISVWFPGCILTHAPIFLPRLPQGGQGRGEEPMFTSTNPSPRLAGRGSCFRSVRVSRRTLVPWRI